MTPPIKIGLVGTSGISDYYAIKLKKIPGVTLQAIHSRMSDRAEAFARKHQIPTATTRMTDLLDDPSIEALLIVNEPSRHIEIARQAVATGKHLLIEKPVAIDLAEAELLMEQTKNSGLVVSVIAPFRFNPVLQEMQAALDPLRGGGPITAMLSMMRPRDQAYYEHGSGWRRSHSAVFMNQGIHWLDVLNWFFGEPLRIHATARITRPFLQCADHGAALIHYPNEIAALVVGGTHVTHSQPDQFTIQHVGGRLDYQTLLGPSPPRDFRTRLGRWLLGQPRWGRSLPDTMRLQLEDFVEAIRQGRPPRVTLTDGIKALRLAVALSHVNPCQPAAS